MTRLNIPTASNEELLHAYANNAGVYKFWTDEDLRHQRDMRAEILRRMSANGVSEDGRNG